MRYDDSHHLTVDVRQSHFKPTVRSRLRTTRASVTAAVVSVVVDLTPSRDQNHGAEKLV